ncbi:ribosomal biogenesis protein LAS1L-like isoform X2 [Anneissia japonica]|uniref:ribosomal biogenesis protein LAS1L-like isoform X2 n=1 Tax=Anneissia japonica TaxID=1529436 RepID=UPI00142563A5|nr:ribosomal biogenesis protein LAS1L-like isoform X2 [Anneissia japonica]XP_033126489.1 ribosomal biogenesis protein LAS1L-like isoform X2 [Anneissia japonica]XP_033126490.1 ribosomal biogenesis protein LAS1L-like isoform X2 [Anneissia japonica]
MPYKLSATEAACNDRERNTKCMTGLSNSVSYLTQSLGCRRQNQLQVEPVTDFGSLHSNVDISEVEDPLHLGKAVKKGIEKDSTSIESLGPIVDSEIGSLHSAETLRSSRASSQAQQPAQSKRLRSCDRAEPQGKRMCRKVKEEDEGKKQNQKEEEKKQDQKKEQDQEEEDEEKEQEKKEKQDQKKVDEQKEQEEKDENELMSNFFPSSVAIKDRECIKE